MSEAAVKDTEKSRAQIEQAFAKMGYAAAIPVAIFMLVHYLLVLGFWSWADVARPELAACATVACFAGLRSFRKEKRLLAFVVDGVSSGGFFAAAYLLWKCFEFSPPIPRFVIVAAAFSALIAVKMWGNKLFGCSAAKTTTTNRG